MPSYGKLFILALTVSLLFGCTGPVVKTSENPRGVYHRVKKGETLWSISHAYHKDILDIVVANKIDNPDLIEVDSVIFIPGADHLEETPALPAKTETTIKKEEAKPEKKSSPPPVVRKEKKAPPIKPVVPAAEATTGVLSFAAIRIPLRLRPLGWMPNREIMVPLTGQIK